MTGGEQQATQTEAQRPSTRIQEQQPPQPLLGPTGRAVQTQYQYLQPAISGYQMAPSAAAGPKGGTLPLGMRASNVPTLGTNVASIYAKNLRQRGHASSQKFTNSFNPDFFVL